MLRRGFVAENERHRSGDVHRVDEPGLSLREECRVLQRDQPNGERSEEPEVQFPGEL